MTIVAPNAYCLDEKRIHKAAAKACEGVAPNFPLDKLIAVNPFWKLISSSQQDVSAKVHALAGISTVMPVSHWVELYKAGEISDHAISRSLVQYDLSLDSATFLSTLGDTTVKQDLPLITAHFDSYRSANEMTWQEECLFQISQFCAAYYQHESPLVQVEGNCAADTLYKSWLNGLKHDAGINILMNTRGLRKVFETLPSSVEALLIEASKTLTLDSSQAQDYFYSLIMSINGWASYIAYRTWLKEGNELQGLLAIRLAWELIVYRYYEKHHAAEANQVRTRWSYVLNQLPARIAQCKQDEINQWVMMYAYEYEQQQRLQAKLIGCTPVEQTHADVQAIFCIDVRSEVIRRVLELQSPSVKTMGFAGFFGMPVAYAPANTDAKRPQLPGLLAPQLLVSESGTESHRTEYIQQRSTWHKWSKSPLGSFSMVESAGWWYAFKLLKNSWLPSSKENPMNTLSHERNWEIKNENGPIGLDDKVALAAGALKMMGMNKFSPTVLLVGHGSKSRNNLHAAGLDCGACGGQSGEVNVRVLAQLLNDEAVRNALKAMGHKIAGNTRFIPALHNTTTDDVECFDGSVPEKVKNWLLKAKHQAQKERAKHYSKNLQFESDKKRDQRFQHRAKDWSQVQPEWGLAGNASFIIGPRQRTRGVDLEGKSFLHDYTWQTDLDSSVLETLMTAPMIVTHWINAQYNASVTDNEKLGSGNKVLHNAVGNNIGVFEGNSGDLRIGLSKQSLHNGERWVHQPQRLSVYIIAPNHKILDIVNKHTMLQELIDNDWLYLFSWDKQAVIERLYKGKWYKSHGLSM
ncbi:YbcC family protein [Alteromonas sp. A081]|uniref:YbcC family protein n=1 Tax=Alteromonas sp. A081 TaxID=3410269 RepID=UPI003B97D118